MSGASEEGETTSQKIFRKILQQGRIPNHIAFILDGNRRYAKRDNLETIEGHKKGGGKFEETIKWAMRCGIKTITAFVFSIDNFNRSRDEVAAIFGLVKSKNERMLANPEDMRDMGIRYQFVGDWSLFPKDLVPDMKKVVEETQHNTRMVVNVAFFYTGRNEITSGVGKLVKQLATNKIDIGCVGESLLERSLQDVPMPPVDLLVRTSETRLSDFLTWATSDRAVLCFLDEYWPNFSSWKFLLCIFYFQISSFRILLAASESRKKCG